jgi:hypothetical protein
LHFIFLSPVPSSCFALSLRFRLYFRKKYEQWSLKIMAPAVIELLNSVTGMPIYCHQTRQHTSAFPFIFLDSNYQRIGRLTINI